jgi:hypothetical protein
MISEAQHASRICRKEYMRKEYRLRMFVMEFRSRIYVMEFRSKKVKENFSNSEIGRNQFLTYENPCIGAISETIGLNLVEKNTYKTENLDLNSLT